MKKKLLKGSILTLAITLVCVAGVSARTSVYSNSSYSISAGATRTFFTTPALKSYKGLEVEVTPRSATSGTKRTTIKAVTTGSLGSGTVMYQDTKAISTTTCTYFDVGDMPQNIGYVNSASGYAGWSGWLKMTSN